MDMTVARHFAWIVLGGALLAWCFAVPFSPRNPGTEPVPAKVETTRATDHVVVTTIEFSGKFVARPEDLIVLDSRQVVRLLVRASDHVKKGQPLAVVEPGALPRPGVPRFSPKFEAARADQLSDQLGSALADHQASLDRAALALEQAKKDRADHVGKAQSELDKVLAGNASDETQLAQRAADDAKTVRDKAKALSDRDQRALSEGWVSRNQASASKGAYEAAESAFQKADSRWQDLKANDVRTARESFARTSDAEDKKVLEAGAELESVQNGGLAFSGRATVVSPVFPDLSDISIRGKIGSRRAVKSPMDGTVLKAGSTLEILRDGAQCELLGNLEAWQAAKLKPGMVVRLPKGESGTVLSIGPADPKTGLSPIRVTCLPRTDLGMAAKATVVIRSLADRR